MTVMVSSTKHNVVRTYQDNHAPTGEGTIYVDEHGTHWRRLLSRPEYTTTGESLGTLREGTIEEDAI